MRTVQLKGNGIITFNDNCVIKDDDLTIQSFRTLTTQTTDSFLPVINLTDELDIEVPDVISLKLNKSLSAASTYSAEYGELKSNLQKLKLQEVQLHGISTHDLHQYSVGYAGLGLGIFIAVLLVIRKYLKNKKTYPMTPSSQLRQQRSIGLSREDFQLDVVHINAGEHVQANKCVRDT